MGGFCEKGHCCSSTFATAHRLLEYDPTDTGCYRSSHRGSDGHTGSISVTIQSDTRQSTHQAWKGIPVMPDATSGEGDEEGYVFTIHATSQQVQDYYQVELARLG